MKPLEKELKEELRKIYLSLFTLIVATGCLIISCLTDDIFAIFFNIGIGAVCLIISTYYGRSFLK